MSELIADGYIIGITVLMVSPIFFTVLLQSYLFKRKTRPIYSSYTTIIEGEALKNRYIKYRQHNNSGLVYHYESHSQGGDWELYGEQESEIILRKEKQGKLS